MLALLHEKIWPTCDWSIFFELFNSKGNCCIESWIYMLNMDGCIFWTVWLTLLDHMTWLVWVTDECNIYMKGSKHVAEWCVSVMHDSFCSFIQSCCWKIRKKKRHAQFVSWLTRECCPHDTPNLWPTWYSNFSLYILVKLSWLHRSQISLLMMLTHLCPIFSFSPLLISGDGYYESHNHWLEKK